MSDRKWQIGKLQIVFRPSSRLLKILVILLVVLSTAALCTLWWVRTDIVRQTEKLRNEAAAVEAENQKLTDKLEDMDSVQALLDIAREEMDMVDENTILIKPQS